MKTFSTIPSKIEKDRKILCPLCSSQDFVTLWDLDNFSYSKCPNCSLVYQNPQPIASDVENRYDESYFSYEIENEDAFLNLMLLGLKDIGFDCCLPIGQSRKILDIGCATGLFLEYMKKLGWDTYGVEVCSSAAEFGNSHRSLNIFNGILDNAPILENSLDVIHLSHVIEHVNEPDKFVKMIFTLLKPGGVAYCTTPNIAGFQARLFKNKWRSVIPDHMVLFSIKTLKKIFRQSGFKIEAYRTWGGLCAGSGYPKLVKKILDRAAKPMGFGDVVIIKAIRPE